MAIMVTVVRTEVFRKILNDIDDIEKAEEYVENTVFDAVCFRKTLKLPQKALW